MKRKEEEETYAGDSTEGIVLMGLTASLNIGAESATNLGTGLIIAGKEGIGLVINMSIKIDITGETQMNIKTENGTAGVERVHQHILHQDMNHMGQNSKQQPRNNQ